MADDATIDEICVTAIADGFRGDGEILCNPIGNVPVIAGRLAKATFESDMVMTDTVSVLAANISGIVDAISGSFRHCLVRAPSYSHGCKPDRSIRKSEFCCNRGLEKT